MKNIAYQGVKGAFSHITALNQFGEDNNYIGLKTFKEVFEYVESGQVEYAVIPIENSLVGSIYENYDLLNRYEIQIMGEHFTRIDHCLLANSSSQIETIKKVVSHPKALEQCASFFQNHPWIEAVISSNTAVAAYDVASKGDPEWAAIASMDAAKLYGLKILKKGIEDDPKNYTRFVMITKNQIHNDEINKCSLLLQLKHVSGSLAKVLGYFADQSINLTKIESRPIHGSPFEYLFYVDFEFAKIEKQNIENLLNRLCSQVLQLKILGFYKKGTLWIN